MKRELVYVDSDGKYHKDVEQLKREQMKINLRERLAPAIFGCGSLSVTDSQLNVIEVLIDNLSIIENVIKHEREEVERLADQIGAPLQGSTGIACPGCGQVITVNPASDGEFISECGGEGEGVCCCYVPEPGKEVCDHEHPQELIDLVLQTHQIAFKLAEQKRSKK